MGDRGIEVAPAPVAARRRRVGPIASVALAAAVLTIATLKPWASSAPAPAPGPSRPAASPTAPAVLDGPTATPDALGDPLSEATGWDPVSGLMRQLGVHGGSWGVGALGLGPGPSWVEWRPAVARPVGGRPVGVADPGQPAVEACRSVALRSGPIGLAITGPPSTLADAGVAVTLLGPSTVSVDDAPVAAALRILRPVGTPGTLFLVVGPGIPWPDGAYRLIVERSDLPPAELGVCLGSG